LSARYPRFSLPFTDPVTLSKAVPCCLRLPATAQPCAGGSVIGGCRRSALEPDSSRSGRARGVPGAGLRRRPAPCGAVLPARPGP
jgi:hypothetical protein